MKKKLLISLLAIFIIALVIGIAYKNASNKGQQENNNFKIVTTFYPIYIMTANITQGAQNIELVNMTETNIGCLHDYTLSTTDMKKIENADVIIQNGLGLENFMDKILNSYSSMTIIDSSKNVTNKIEENEETNNHIWTSITNYMVQVEEITNELSKINPENSPLYNENKQKYLTKLQELKSEYDKQLAKLKGKKAICLNEALTYLAKEAGLIVTSVETDHEESSLSAENMKSLIEKMKSENISAILVDSEDNLKSAETLASEIGAKIYKLKSGLTGSLELDAYINDMKENLEILKEI